MCIYLLSLGVIFNNDGTNKVIVYRVIMYASPLLIVYAYCIFNYYKGDSGLTNSILLLVNSCNCTVKLTEYTGRELSSPWMSQKQIFGTTKGRLIDFIHNTE